MIYLNSKYLSKKLEINLAKWKRWAREFLDPDPLGGYQSGFARQFSYKDSFRVYLGGHLVGALKFTIPEARQILHDLDGWLKKNKLYTWPLPEASFRKRPNHIYIYQFSAGAFGYAVRTLAEPRRDSAETLQTETYALELIGLIPDDLGAGRPG